MYGGSHGKEIKFGDFAAGWNFVTFQMFVFKESDAKKKKNLKSIFFLHFLLNYSFWNLK